jgi:cytochrome c oxidase subunit 2
MSPVAADTRAAYDGVAALYLPIALAVFVLVSGAVVLLVWRGRRRAAPGGREERPLAEALYVGVLAVTVAVLVAVTFTQQGRVEASTAARPALDVTVTAAKWNWRFGYPAYGIAVAGGDRAPATLVVPAGRQVRFAATSLDVLHGFWIPARRFQRQLAPGRRTVFALTFPSPGVETNATCSMFCGLGHGDMRFDVRVLDPAAFDAWARAHRRTG